MPITARDPDEKRRRGYSDPKSIVWADGREVLQGFDWAKRVRELYDRCGGRCEHEQPWKVWPLGGPMMERCTNDAEDPHHRIPRSKGRDDRLENLQALCRYHHNLLDKRKVKWSKP